MENKNSRLFRVHNSSLEKIESIYNSTTEGVNRCLEIFFNVKRFALLEIKNVSFENEEIIAMADCCNGTIISGNLAWRKETFLFEIEDFENLDKGVSKHGADFQMLKDKINALSDFAFAIMHEELHLFWNEPAVYGAPNPNLDALIKKLSNK